MATVAMMEGWNPKTAIVTGSGRGLGQAMALGLLSDGFNVVIHDRDQSAIDETITLAARASSKERYISICCDISDAMQVQDLVCKTIAHFGGLHILINNAGVGPEIVRPDFMKNPVRLWEISADIWCRAIGINTLGPLYAASAAVPHMIEAGWGRVINVTTSLDTMIRSGYAPYGGSKAATEAYTAILAGDLAGTGVTANVLIPGGAANTRLIPADAPVDRKALVQPERMVEPLLWLVSERANDMSGRRILARFWRGDLSPDEAAVEASAPAGWPGIERTENRLDI